ncbi:PTS system cellobiose-specific IIC component [Spiroplasma chinense]|uniref:PTS system cellobiose-specific IIC component n=1 Tax=Spiroplasma chinense TaxID=216932 RepID=A0A5B9Y4E0_9MOLU|nr:PTS transporter subunit EIIC [Spiroplasma chinense]QEH61549.1 PTS system cellobiose-specific IIC component [Spiroplasma chinense]
MEKYAKFPEINSLYNTIIQNKQTYKKNTQDIKESRKILSAKKHKAKDIKHHFKKIMHGKINELKNEFNINLTGSKYVKNDIDAMYEKYNNEVTLLKQSYKEKTELRVNKANDEIKSIESAIKVMKEKNKALSIKNKELKITIKDKWTQLESVRNEKDIELKNDVVVAAKIFADKKAEFKQKYIDDRNKMIEEFKVENPEIKNFNSILRKQTKSRLKPFKSDDERKVYELTVALNQLAIQFKNKVSFQKKMFRDTKLEVRYNKGKGKPLSFKVFIDNTTKAAGAFSNNKFISALRGGFFSIMPLVIVGAAFILINNIILSAANGGLFNFFVMDIDSLNVLNQLKSIGVNIWNGTYAFYALLLGAAIAYHLAPYYKVNSWGAAMLTCASIVVMNTTIFSDLTSMGSSGMFTAILVAFLSTVIYGKASENEKLKIKMPESVPDGVAKSFNNLIPYALVLIMFSLMAFTIAEVGLLIGDIKIGNEVRTFSTFNELIVVVVQKPLVHAVSGFGGMVTIVFFWQILWFLGIHASGILSPIVEPIQLTGLIQNQEALAIGADPKYVFTNPFMNNFIHLGGTGGTIALIIAIFVFSKRSDWRAMAKITIIPALFCVNEPLMFGLPIVLNPILLIPFVIGPLIAGMFAYFATVTGMMSYTSVIVPWTTPPIIGGFLSTKDVWGGIVALINFGILLSVYTPFVLLANKLEKRELMTKYKNIDLPGMVIQDKIQTNIIA